MFARAPTGWGRERILGTLVELRLLHSFVISREHS